MVDERQKEKENTILTDIQAEKTLSRGYESVKSFAPTEISRQYIATVKKAEEKLLGTSVRYNRQLEKADKSKPRTAAGIFMKSQKTQYYKKRVKRVEQKRKVYISKNYRRQTIKREIYINVSHKLTEKTKSSLLGIEPKASVKSKSTSNLLCLDMKKDGGNNAIGLIAPSVKKAQINKINKTLRNSGSNLIRNMKIKAALESEEPAMEVVKSGITAGVNMVIRLAEVTIKSSLKLALKLLMPIIPYIVLCFVPFILIIIFAASGSNDINNSSISGGTDINKVMERAKSFVGEDGTKIWEYYGMKNHWCCMFIWTCFNMEEAGDLFYDGEKTAYVPDLDTWALSHPEQIIYYKNNITGKIIGNPSAGRYGDIVLYDYAPYDNYSDHVAFIESYNEDGSYTTIEGNTGGTGTGYDFYTSSSVHLYTSYLWSNSGMLHMIIRPQYNSISK